jgi:iron complex transport system permease protein
MAPRIALSAVACILALLLAPLAGSSHLDWDGVWRGDPAAQAIFWDVRVPRVLLSAIAGGGLALAGLLFQALLRDALATPYTLGISSGASLGAVIAICLGASAIWPAALVGAVVSLSIVAGVASEDRRMSSFTLLLTGVTVNSMAMALILFLQSSTTLGQSITITRWLMGSIEVVDRTALWWLFVVLTCAAAWTLWRAGDWNLLSVGEDWAASRGVAVQTMMMGGYVTASLLTASIATFTGPIGFVGLIVPHALRLWLGADHRALVPCAVLWGSAFLVICDAIARTAMAPAEIPAGVITSLFGGPFFIWLLRTRRRNLSL